MKKLILFTLLFFNILFAINISIVNGQPIGPPAPSAVDSVLDKAAGEAGFDSFSSQKNNPFALQEMAGRFINVFLSLLGVIFTCLIIYGGYLWMMARGNEEEVKKSKDLMVNASIGLAIVVAAYAITYFVLSYLAGKYMTDTSLE